MAMEVGATEFAFSWTHNSNDLAESFIINCTNSVSTVSLDQETGSTSMESGSTNMESGSDDMESGGSGGSGSADPDSSAMMPDEDSNSTFVYSITGLEEHTTYTCSISARNTFGTGPASETITIMTGSRGKAEFPVRIPSIVLNTLHWPNGSQYNYRHAQGGNCVYPTLVTSKKRWSLFHTLHM